MFFRLICVSLFLVLDFEYCFSQEDSLLNLFNNSNSDTVRVNLANELSVYYYRKNPEKNYEYANTAYRLSEKVGYSKGNITALANIGSYLISINKFDTAYFCLLKAKNKAIALGLKKEEAIAKNRLGVYHFYLGQTDSAIEYFSQASKIFELAKDPVESCKIENNLGAIFRRKGDINKALISFFKCLRFDEAQGSLSNIASDFNNIGVAYIDKKILLTLVSF